MTKMLYLSYGNGRQFAIVVGETRGTWKIRRLYGRGNPEYNPPWVGSDSKIPKKDIRLIAQWEEPRTVSEIEIQHCENRYYPPQHIDLGE